MKSRTRAIIGLAILLMAAVVWMITRSGITPPPPSITPEVKTSEPAEIPAAAPAITEATVPPNPVPELQSPADRLPVPKPRTEASRAASKRDLAEPLMASDLPDTRPSPRRVSDVIPEAAPEFDKIALMFRDYRTLTGENPVGTNAEIMKALMGDNPRSAKLGPPEGQNVNSDGELIDRWGTPYFFHQLTKDRMEIRSAGPDRILWNEDDLTGD